jgi:hypothetical protein
MLHWLHGDGAVFTYVCWAGVSAIMYGASCQLATPWTASVCHMSIAGLHWPACGCNTARLRCCCRKQMTPQLRRINLYPGLHIRLSQHSVHAHGRCGTFDHYLNCCLSPFVTAHALLCIAAKNNMPEVPCNEHTKIVHPAILK